MRPFGKKIGPVSRAQKKTSFNVRRVLAEPEELPMLVVVLNDWVIDTMLAPLQVHYPPRKFRGSLIFGVVTLSLEVAFQ